MLPKEMAWVTAYDPLMIIFRFSLATASSSGKKKGPNKEFKQGSGPVFYLWTLS